MLANKGYAPKLESNKLAFHQKIRNIENAANKPAGSLNSDLKVLQDILYAKTITNEGAKKHSSVRFEGVKPINSDVPPGLNKRSIIIPNITMNLDIPLEDSEYIQLSNPNNHVTTDEIEEDSTNQDSGSKPDSASSSLYENSSNENHHVANFVVSHSKQITPFVPKNRSELKSELKNHLQNRDERNTHSF